MAGLPWYGLWTDFPNHGKTLALCAALRDDNAGMYFIRLLSHCATQALDGRVALAIVESVAGWKKKRGVLLAALTATGFLEPLPDGMVLVHGWEERNGSRIRKALADNARPSASRRSPRENPEPIPTKPRAGFSLVDRQPDRDRDPVSGISTVSVPPPEPSYQPPPIAREAGGDRLEAIRGRLAAHFGLPRVVVGKDADRVEASFSRWLRLPGGEDAVFQACLDFAAEKREEPASLSWFPGFLDTVPLGRVESSAAWWAANPAANSRDAAGGEA